MPQNKLKEHFLEISSAEKGVRLFGLEKILELPSFSPTTLEFLTRRLQLEKDRECQMLLKQILERGKSGKRRKILFTTTEEISKIFEKSTPLEKLEILDQIPNYKISIVLPLVPSWFKSEKNPNVLAKMSRVLGPSMPVEALPLLAKKLIGKYLGVRLAVLEVLIARAPQQLASALPGLLSSKDPRLFTLAVQGLAKIDEREAIRHIEVMVLHDDQARRNSGIKCALHLPFEKTKPVLLKMLAKETDPLLLHKCGLVFQTNPDPEVPYLLGEMMLQVSPEKEDRINSILQGVLSTLKKSKIIGDEYLGKLSDWNQKKRCIKIIKNNLDLLETDDLDKIKGRLLIERKLPKFLETLEEALQWPVSEQAKNLIKEVLSEKQCLREENEETEENQRPGWSEILVQDEKIRIINSWMEKDRILARPILDKILFNADEPYELKIPAIRAVARLKIPDFFELACKWVFDKNLKFGFAVLEYLGTIRPTEIFTILHSTVKKGDQRQRQLSLKILKEYYPGKTESIIVSLLRSKYPVVQGAAISGMFGLNFPLVRESLTSFLETNPETEFLPQALFLYQINPEFENMYSLFCIEKVVDVKRKTLVRKARRRIEDLLLKYDRLESGSVFQLESEFQLRWKMEKARIQALPSYSVEALNLTK